MIENGAIVGAVVVGRDVTAYKRAEKALRTSEAHFRTLADNMSQFAWIADKEGRISWCNRRWFNFTGANPEEMKGWGWTRVIHPEQVDRVVEKLERHLSEGHVWEDTFPLRGRGGEYRWFLSRAVPIRDGAGDILRWFGTHTDITEQRQAKQALLLMNETLEQQVAERTVLAENRAKQLQTLAVGLIEAEERERRRIAYLLHDDLQQLLASASMQVQAVSGSRPPDPLLMNIEQIMKESIAKSRRAESAGAASLRTGRGIAVAGQADGRAVRFRHPTRNKCRTTR